MGVPSEKFDAAVERIITGVESAQDHAGRTFDLNFALLREVEVQLSIIHQAAKTLRILRGYSG